MTRISKFFLSFLCLLVVVFIAPRGWADEDTPVMEDKPLVKLQALDKSTARTVTFQAKVGSTIQYGSLFIKIQACRQSPPLEQPESAAFLQIWEVPIGKEKSEWIFSGWMFASSPALSAMDHPVYDVWVLDCLDGDEQNKEAQESETKALTADPTALEAVQGDAAEAAQEKDQTAPDEKNINDILDEVTTKTEE